MERKKVIQEIFSKKNERKTLMIIPFDDGSFLIRLKDFYNNLDELSEAIPEYLENFNLTFPRFENAEIITNIDQFKKYTSQWTEESK